jgi:DNA polymerase-3 subunit beta
MKFTVKRTPFLKALSHGQSVVEKRTIVPILSHVLLNAKGNTLTLTSTDLELTIVETIPAQVTESGSFAIPAHMLHDIVRKLPDRAEIQLALELKNNRLKLQAARSDFSLSCLPAEDFPSMENGDLPNTFLIPARDLFSLIDRVRFAMSNEETRYNLNGVYLHVIDNMELRAVATDGHRLAKVAAGLPEGAAGMPGIILPRKTVIELLKLIAELTGDVKVSISETQISFSFADIYLTSRLIDGMFPDYDPVIPKDNNKVIQVPVRAFTDAVDRVATVTEERERGVRVTFKNGRLILSATSPETGSAIEEINIDYSDTALEIGFNSRYLLDITQQILGEEAEFSMADAATAVIFRDREDKSALYVLMPLRV